MYRLEMTLRRNFQKLRGSPGVRYESVGRGFESLPSHQEKPVHTVQAMQRVHGFFVKCAGDVQKCADSARKTKKP